MANTEIRDRLGAILAKELHGFDYDRPRSRLVQISPAGWKGIALDVMSRELGKKSLSLAAELRINRLADRFLPHSPGLKPQEIKKTFPILYVNCANFMHSDFLYSFNTDEASIQGVASHFAEGIRNEVIPFLEKYFDEATLVESFLDDDSTAWVTSNPKTRYTVLLSHFALRGDWDAFDKYAKEWEAFCQTPFGMMYKQDASSIISGMRSDGYRDHQTP